MSNLYTTAIFIVIGVLKNGGIQRKQVEIDADPWIKEQGVHLYPSCLEFSFRHSRTVYPLIAYWYLHH